MDDQTKYSKLCVYWIGPFIPYVVTSDIEILKKLMHQPGGCYYVATHFVVSKHTAS